MPRHRREPVDAAPLGHHHPLTVARLQPLQDHPQNESPRMRKDHRGRMRQALHITVVKRTRLRPVDTNGERIRKKGNLQTAEPEKTRGHGPGRGTQKLRMAALNSKESLTRERSLLLRRQGLVRASTTKIRGALTEKQKGPKRILRLLTTVRANSVRPS